MSSKRKHHMTQMKPSNNLSTEAYTQRMNSIKCLAQLDSMELIWRINHKNIQMDHGKPKSTPHTKKKLDMNSCDQKKNWKNQDHCNLYGNFVKLSHQCSNTNTTQEVWHYYLTHPLTGKKTISLVQRQHFIALCSIENGTPLCWTGIIIWACWPSHDSYLYMHPHEGEGECTKWAKFFSLNKKKGEKELPKINSSKKNHLSRIHQTIQLTLEPH